jgi:AraC family transcriptional regulator of adaptative response/methylated-DNA-[protein]-cysteine methyltransferase
MVMQNKRAARVNGTSEDARRWAVLVGKTPKKPASFLYGVRTTGIYCRPGCASRLPKRENVNFFTNAAAAEKAGLRPCKRCRPLEASNIETHKNAVKRTCALMEKAEHAPSLDALAKAANMSRHHFHRVFKKIMGTTPQDYLRALQVKKFGAKLKEGKKVSTALFDAGFGSSSRAYAHKNALGMTPKALQRGGKGETIRYTVGDTALGKTLVAITTKGLCMTGFDDHAQPLISDMKKRFANAEFVEDKKSLKKWLDSVATFLESPADKFDLPLDLRGTAFQARVWRALQKIPPGETRSYAEIAKAIGSKDAVRAVGTACGRNPVSLFVPCHRVITSDGKITGYHWGKKRKEILLKKEAEATR